MIKKTVFIAMIIGVLLVGGALGFIMFVQKNPTLPGHSTVPAGSSQKSEEKPLDSPSQVIKVGVMICLEPVQTDGPQTMECAFGLREDDGTTYGLRSEEPMLIGSVPTGQRIQVTGTLVSPSKVSDKYDTRGTVDVQTLQRL
jgi:hypothetical protein